MKEVKSKAANLNEQSLLHWEDWELDIIRERYPDEGVAIIKDLKPNRTKEAIRAKANVLKVFRNRKPIWEDWELDIIRERYPDEGFDIIPYLNSKNQTQLIRQTRKMGLKVNSRRDWTEEELSYLKEHGTESPAKIARNLNRAESSVKLKLKQLGLRQPKKRNKG